ncbi:MAG: type 2 lanthipeptide synthetase LanM family protein [Myxococcota bacterium]
MLAPRLATHRIVARAASLYERSGSSLAVDTPATAERVERWTERVDPLRQRLDLRRAFDELPAPERALADLVPDPDAPLPGWASLIETVASRAGRGPATERDYFMSGLPAPFQELLAHFVDEGYDRLQAAAGAELARLDDAVKADLRLRLLRSLGWLSTASLRLELRLECQRSESPLERMARQARGETSRRHYDRFIARLCADGMQSFFLEYSALARAMGTAVLHWVEATAEFVQRLDADWSALTEAFADGRDETRVARLDGGISDRHNGGRSVLIVTMGEGTKVVYKPRPLGIEVAWFDLLRWFAADGAPYQHRPLSICSRPDYGWVEFVEAAPCAARAEIVAFYERLGAMLAILHTFEATDCHFENVIAAGADPVLIDAETVMHPRFAVRPSPMGTGAQQLAREQTVHSVQRPGLLPEWTMGIDGKSMDISGAGAAEGQVTDREFMGWHGVNTDDFDLAPTRLPLGGQGHAPQLDGESASVLDHQDAFARGFERMYRYLLEARARIDAPAGPLQGFAGQRVRVVLRPTRLYSDLLENGCHPDLMRDGVDRGIHFDLLGRPPHHDDRPPYWDSVRIEHAALTRLDIPAFYAPTERAELQTGTGELVSSEFLRAAPLDGVRERLAALGEEDLALQLSYIQASIQSRNGRVTHGHDHQASEAPLEVDPASVDFVAEAERIGDQLDRAAIKADDGSMTWISFEHLFGSDAFRLGPCSTLLYGGSLGVGLFFAALHRVTGKERWKTCCHATLAHVYAEIDGGFEEGILPWSTGGLTGDGSVIYTLAKAAEYLDDPSLLARAEVVMERLATLYADDEELDATKGNAGAILGLLRMHAITGSARALELARACAEHLLPRLLGEPGAEGSRWMPGEERPLAGLSHGASGFALAFARLSELDPDPRYRQVVEAAVAYERTAFDPRVRNWYDLREADEHGRFRSVSSWCYGAPGIGMSRAAMLDSVGSPLIREDLEHAVATTRMHGAVGEGNVCCGVFGRLEALLTMGRATGRTELGDEVQAWTAAVVEQARAHGGYSLLIGLPREALQVGLFDGLAGVGFHLLRVHDPETIGTFMLWE